MEPGCDPNDCSIRMLYLLIQQIGTENTCYVTSFQGVILRIIGKEKRIARKNNRKF